MLGIVLLTLAGCSHGTVRKDTTGADVSGQWILESYNETTGYTFRKDGVTYLTRCGGVNWGHGKGVEPITRQFVCSSILGFLHKPVPSLHLGFIDETGTIVPLSTSSLYYDDDGRKYLFEIIEAK